MITLLLALVADPLLLPYSANLPVAECDETAEYYSIYGHDGTIYACTSSGWLDVASSSGFTEADVEAVCDLQDLQGAVTDAQVPDNITVTLAATASALAANGANCSGNNFALGVDASGVGECAQPAFSNLSGSATDGQIPDTITIDLATTATTANAGDSATSFFPSGTIEAARGGTGDDTSGSTGVAQVTAGNWTYDAGIADIGDDASCTGGQSVRRNAGDTAFECFTPSAGSGAPRMAITLAVSVLPNVIGATGDLLDNCTLALANLGTTKKRLGSQHVVTMDGFANARGVFRLKNAAGQSGQISCSIRNVTDGTDLIASTNVTTGTTCVTATGTATPALTGQKQLACYCSNATAADDPLLGYCGLELAP